MIPSDTFEEQLREQLHTTTPGPYAGLDPAAVIGAGTRVRRRRRIGTALVAAAVVAVVAVGGSVLTGGRPTAAPVPAGPSVGSGPGTAHLTIAQNGKPARGYTVTLSPDPDQPGRLRETWRQDGVDGSVGSGVDQADPRATWGFGGDSPFVLGLVPDEAARSTISVGTDRDYGGYAVALEPVKGTGWSAFVLAFDQPLVGTDPITSLLWFDRTGRPVDKDGRVGDSASVGGRTAWLTADGTELGVLGTGSTPAVGPLPVLVSSTSAGTSTQQWDLTLLLPATALDGTARFADGRSVPVTTAPLGTAHRVGAVTVTAGKNAPPAVASYTWKDAGGASHEVAAR